LICTVTPTTVTSAAPVLRDRRESQPESALR